MAKFVVEGPVKLEGSLTIAGSKNAVLKQLAACILATKPVELHNVPAIRDVRVMIKILEALGAEVEASGGTLQVNPANIKSAALPDELASQLRASIVVLGPLLGRFGEAKIAHPGGDVIGRRRVDIHFRGFESLGAEVTVTSTHYEIKAKKLKGATIFLEEASVTATENLMMAAVLAEGTTIIHNAASEPHTKDLAVMLNELGARISGEGTNTVTIEGVKELSGGTHTVRPDEIGAGTFLIAAGLTGGELELQGIDPGNFGLILYKLSEAGIQFDVGEKSIRVTPPHNLLGTNVQSGLWPAFPSDLISPFTLLMTQAQGMSLIHDWMYEGRFFYTDKLVSMGANIILADPHRIIVQGPTPLYGKELATPDLRAGFTMLIAAMIAEGTTVIDHAEIIDRGYEHVEDRLTSLGAKIQRLEEKDIPV